MDYHFERTLTTEEWIKRLQNVTGAPRWFIDEIWDNADIDMLLESENEKEYEESLNELKNDIEMRIKMLQKIKDNLDNIPFEKLKR